MRESVNLIQVNQKLPLTFSAVKFDNIFLHMHSSIQLIIVLDGEFECYIEDKRYICKENDIFIINPRTYHHFVSKNNATILSVLIDQNEFGLDEIEADKLAFSLNSMERSKHPRYDTIKYLIYSLIRFNSMDNVNSIHTNKAISFSLFAQLMNDFQINLSESDHLNVTNYDTITKITAYINDHYKENITLSFLSSHFNYSIAYLSRLFKKNLGSNFIDYYDELRINYSLNDLLLTNKRIEDIALDNGFENSRSYFRAFTNRYKLYPSKYRKEYKTHRLLANEDESLTLKKDALDKILNLYNSLSLNSNNPNHELTRDTSALVSIDYNSSTIKLEAPYQKVLQFNQCKNILDFDIQKRLEEIQNDIKFEYITINNLEDTEFKFLHKIFDEIHLSFIPFDRMISFLKSINIKPYIKLEYNKNIFSEEQYLSYIYKFVEHLKQGYSKDEINSWMINFSMSELSKFNKSEYENFLHLYEEIYRIFKHEFKQIKFGSPTFNKDEILINSYYKDFINFAKTKFYDINFYSISYQNPNKTSLKLSKNKDELKDFINKLKEQKLFIENKMYFENINFTSNKSLLNDTLYSSSYLSKNLIDNIKSISCYSKLGFSDLTITSIFEKNPFSGYSGFFTFNHLKKPSYHAYQLYSKLGSNLLKKSNNYIITTDNNKIIILINNYSHYSDLYAENEYYQISNEERYQCFPKSTNINFRFDINNIPFSNCRIKTTSLSKVSGSTFEKWLESGAPSILTNDEINTLKNISEMSFTITNKEITSSKLNVECSVSPLETKLIEIFLSK